MRLATFNILSGRSPTDGRVDVGRLAAAIRQLDPDVLALQEVDRNQTRSSGVDLAAIAAEAMGAVDYRFAATVSGTPGATWQAWTGDEPGDSAAYGIALLSRVPVGDWRVLRLPLRRPNVPIVLPGSHLRPIVIHDEPRVAIAASLHIGGRLCMVASTHLSFLPWRSGHQLRNMAAGLAASRLPRVVLGDLNLTPQIAVRHSGLRPAVSAPTYPADRPRRQIDHVLTDPILPLGECSGSSLQLALSDHRALVLDVPDDAWFAD